MSKMKFGLLVLISGVFLTSFGLYAEKKTFQQHVVTESTFIERLQSKIGETIQDSQDIPGLKSEEFFALRNEIFETWNSLAKEGVVEVSGTDKNVRPCFVALQGIIEYVLASELQKEIKAIQALIHTPMPATPLCTTGEISKELVDPSIENDSASLLTVTVRTTTIRNLLAKGGNVFIIYPKDGYHKRTEEQQKIYQQELVKYPTHLFDVPLNCESIPESLIGATYFFQDQAGNLFAFAIKMTQAKEPKERGNFGLWFGSLQHPSIQERLEALSSYLIQCDYDF